MVKIFSFQVAGARLAGLGPSLDHLSRLDRVPFQRIYKLADAVNSRVGCFEVVSRRDSDDRLQ